MSAGRVVLLVFGIIFLVGAVFMMVAGGGLVWANGTFTDNEGFFATETSRIESDGYAIVSEPVRIDWGMECGVGWRCSPGNPVTFKMEGSNRDASKGIFIGIVEESDVDQYLRGVEYDEIVQWHADDFGVDVKYDTHEGTAVPAAPASQDWATSVHGTGTRTLEWEPQSGNWVLVVMNEDGSAGINVDGAVGVKVPWVFRAGVGLLIAGVVVLVAGIIMVCFAARRPKKTAA
ncbi:MAG: hypothetical protein NTZ04_04085 [Chloroflexi bacterium]|nr:hypothetical protein [Chloroflexota bacterium]